MVEHYTGRGEIRRSLLGRQATAKANYLLELIKQEQYFGVLR